MRINMAAAISGRTVPRFPCRGQHKKSDIAMSRFHLSSSAGKFFDGSGEIVWINLAQLPSFFEQRVESIQPVGFACRFVPADAMNPREAHRYAGFVAA
jgi:hypothetical protein